jgi:hypothetical protein
VASLSFLRFGYNGLRQNNLSDASERLLDAFRHFVQWLGEFVFLGFIPAAQVMMTCPSESRAGSPEPPSCSDSSGLLEYSSDYNLSCFFSARE